MSKAKTLCIAEWQSFGVDEIAKICGDKKRAGKIFAEFEDFAKENPAFLGFAKDKIKAKNYVGIVQVKSGFVLEILPKIFRTKDENSGFKITHCTCQKPCHVERSERSLNLQNDKICPICKAKEILINMLKTLKNSPFKESEISALNARNFPLLEIFAKMFLNELEKLVKRGLKSDYLQIAQNRSFLKGKLIFSENLKRNFAHKERFFTDADEFSANIAPNRLIVSTLGLLATQGFGAKTSSKITQLRFIFEGISPSKNIDKDLAQSENSRHFKHYYLALLWCKIFLKRQSFMPYFGTQNAFALLFDMNFLFESFVAWAFRHNADFTKRYFIRAQERQKYLITLDNQDKFTLKPDLVIYERGNSAPVAIADTKWKIIDNEHFFSQNNEFSEFSRHKIRHNAEIYGISQNDLYQMFAYLAKYDCKMGILIYPKIKNAEQNELKFSYKANKASLKTHFFELEKDKIQGNLNNFTPKFTQI